MDISSEELNNMNFITDDEVLEISKISEEQNNGKSNQRYRTGFNIFDEAILGGFEDSNLIVLTGISGQGKTSFAQTLTYNFCKNNIPCLWFSYEVPCSHLDRKFRNMGIDNFYFAYSPKKNTSGKISWVSAKIKEGWAKFGTKIVFIDHLDYIVPNNVVGTDNQASYLKNVAKELKSLAIELGIVIVAIAHLKKLQDDKEPDMQDIGYSAGIYQNADHVFIVFREKNKKNKQFGENEDVGNVYTNNSIIKLVKNRETGQTKIIKCEYVKDKFIQLTKKYDEPPREYKVDPPRDPWYDK